MGPDSSTLPGIHDHDPVGHPGDHGQVMGHVDHRHVLVRAQTLQLRQHPVLGQHVQSRGRLVEHRDLRLAHRRHRDRDALLLAAGQLVWIPAVKALVATQIDPRQRGRDRVLPRAGAMGPEHVEDRVTDPHGRVQRPAGILRHIRDGLAPQAPKRPRVATEDVLAAHLDLSPRNVDPGPAVTRATPAQACSCRCPTHQPRQGSRPGLISKLTSSTTGSPVSRRAPGPPRGRPVGLPRWSCLHGAGVRGM